MSEAREEKIALGEERAVGREVEEQPYGREHQQSMESRGAAERRRQRVEAADGRAPYDSAFAWSCFGQPSVASPKQSPFRQILAGKFASFPALCA